MEIFFESQLHRDLFKQLKMRSPDYLMEVWSAFENHYPQFSKYKVDWLSSRGAEVTPLSLQIPWINYPAIDFLEESLGETARVFEWGLAVQQFTLLKIRRKLFLSNTTTNGTASPKMRSALKPNPPLLSQEGVRRQRNPRRFT